MTDQQTAKCAHPQCGVGTACSRPDCPVVMLQAGNGRWQWALRVSDMTTALWPDGIRPSGRSGENWYAD